MEKLNSKNNSITISNVSPIDIITALGGEYYDVNIIGGKDLDYDGEMDNYYFNGSAFWGKCTISLKESDLRDSEDLEKNYNQKKKEEEYNKLYNPSPIIKGYIRNNVPPVKDNVSEEEIRELVNKNILKKFYVWRRTTDGYTVIYAKSEIDARQRILAIWNDYNDICNETEFQLRRQKTIDPKRYLQEGPTYVLDWN